MPQIRVGIVGLSTQGWAAATHAPALLRRPLSDEYSLVAVSTTNRESAQEAAEKYSQISRSHVKAFYGDTSAIATNPSVDIVLVSVKAVSHKAAALPVIAAGKDLFLEWPAGTNLAETTEMANAARARGIRTMVGMQGRQSPILKKVTRLYLTGLLI